MANLTEKLVGHALNTRFEDLNKSTIDVQKRSLADLLSVSMAATTLGTASVPFLRYAETLPGEPICTLLGSEKKVSPTQAALANGALVHALDYEDSHDKAPVHPNSVSTPALMALAEYKGDISGKDFLTALVLASDITCRMDFGLSKSVLRYGWNMPPIHGTIGAAMAAARMMGMDYGQVLDTVSLSMCMSACSGEVANCSQSDIRTVRDGMAASAVVNAALLTQSGSHARFDDPIEGKMAYYTMFAHGEYNPDGVVRDLGKVYESELISFKPWPSCRGTHTAIDAILQLINENDINPDTITNIHLVKQADAGRMVLEPNEIRYRPKTVPIAKFSLPFVVGALIHDRKISLDTFTEEKFNDPEILALADKVTYELRDDWGKAKSQITQVKITTTKGEYYNEVFNALGSVEKPLSDEWMKNKFFDCGKLSAKHYSDTHLQKIYDTICRLDELDNVQELFNML